MKLKKTFGQKIYIEWIDAYTSDGWTTFEEAIKESSNAFCRTNALFVSESKNFIVVSHTQGKTKNSNIMGVLSIPKKWITKIR